MPKRMLSAAEQAALRQELQRATIAALMASRRWEPADIAFQGGTALHLAHGSVRFSEDLDFMIRGGLSLAGLAEAVRRNLDPGSRVPAGLQLSVTPGRDERNPHAFDVTLSGPEVIGSARVKVELWQTDAQVLRGLSVVVRQVQAPSGEMSSVPVLELREILADKVYALGARSRIKFRDVYDLWWLRENNPDLQLTPAALAARLHIYPQGDAQRTARLWLENAEQRAQALLANGVEEVAAADLRRWLPASVNMDAGKAGTMVRAASRALHHGMQTMREIEKDLQNDAADDRQSHTPRPR